MCSKRKRSPSTLGPQSGTNQSTDLDSVASNMVKPPGLAEILDNADPRRIVILRLKYLLMRIGLSRSTVYNMLKPDGKYFDPALASCKVQLTQKSIGFIESGVNQWLETKIAATRNGEGSKK
jgi:predicted DNA-binding transcriptional regulator AlpA